MSATTRYAIPREHGAWGMLLFPMAASALLTRTATPLHAAAFGAALAAFVAREALVILARQRWVWRQPRPEADAARRTLPLAAFVLLLSGLALASVVPVAWLAGLLLGGLVLGGVATYAAVRGKQRSPAVQLLGAAGLSAAALLPWLASGREPFAATVWLLILAHTVHSTGGVLTVHARLETLRGRKSAQPERVERRLAWAWQPVQAVAAIGLGGWLAAGLALPAVAHAADLLRLDDSRLLAQPLRRVGLRELSLSALQSASAVVGLWSTSGGPVPQ
ncbi:MAG: hypothetical protein GC160_12230 [Acidobacteria bacterium]|nr:hypothetical protein [Acidobacteriota bacterium]